MKKSVFLAGAAVMMLALASCGNNGCKGSCDGKTCKGDKVEVYTGVIPAADCDGIRYTLQLEYDDDSNDGDYNLVETYLQADSLATLGVKDLKSYHSEGDFKIEKQGDKTYLRLVKDQKDSAMGSVDAPVLLVSSDSTVTLVNQQLEVPADTAAYTLKLSK